jgi:alpha-tubulin suppressor-like RCC1 family protein
VVGSNSLGQSGLGATQYTSTFVQIPDVPWAATYTVTSVAAGGDHTLLLLTGRADSSLPQVVYAFGDNSQGQLGLGVTGSPVTTPEAVPFAGWLPQILTVAAGYEHSIISAENGLQVFTFGANGVGQLCMSLSVLEYDLPTVNYLPVNQSATLVAPGGFHTLVYSNGNNLYACGSNTYGQLGFNSLGLPADAFTHVTPAWAGPITALAAGYAHSLVAAKDANGSPAVWSFGNNADGELGVGSSPPTPTVGTIYEVPFIFSAPVLGLAAGYCHTLVLADVSSLYACGCNTDGQLGIGSKLSQVSLQLINTSWDGSSLTAVAAGQDHSVVATALGNVFAFGLNAEGQLGDNTTAGASVPVMADRPWGATSNVSLLAASNETFVLLS